jgi:Gluconate 2-dehydrogenase subunit 3
MPAPLDPSHDEDAAKLEGDPADSDVTRRDWFLKVGQTAVVIGLTDGLQAQQPGKPILPPGLYDPSSDHLAHALMSNTRFHPIPPGSPTDYVVPRSGPFVPQFFSVPDFSVVRRMVEIMLGETQEQGVLVEEIAAWIDLSVFSAAQIREANLRLSAPHRALAVAYYGESEVRSVETADLQKTSREGLEWLAGYVKGRYHSDFLSLNENDQLEILKAVSDERPDKHVENAGTRLFKLMKDEFIRGFYTSPAGLKELDYKGNAFYAQSPGCKKQ